jgi:GTP1/Obg family GTP-binding protein
MKTGKGYIPRIRPGEDLELQKDLREAYDRLYALQERIERDLGVLNSTLKTLAKATNIIGTSIALAKVTPTGADGSLTFNNEGVIISYVAPK